MPQLPLALVLENPRACSYRMLAHDQALSRSRAMTQVARLLPSLLKEALSTIADLEVPLRSW